MKRTTITVTYRLDDSELIQCTVSIPTNYPDVVAEARATVLALLHCELADVLAQTRNGSA